MFLEQAYYLWFIIYSFWSFASYSVAIAPIRLPARLVCRSEVNNHYNTIAFILLGSLNWALHGAGGYGVLLLLVPLSYGIDADDPWMDVENMAQDDDLSSHFQSAMIMDTGRFHPLISATTRQLLSAPLPPHLASELPDVRQDLGFEPTGQSRARSSVALSAIRRNSNKSLLLATAPADDRLAKYRLPPAPEWDHVQGFVHGYHDLVDEPGGPVQYNRKISLANVDQPFRLQQWWDYLLSFCAVCQAHNQRWPSFEEVILNNESNPCPHADILSWLSGNWRIPLSKVPEPATRRNHPSLLWSVSSMQQEIDRMLQWRTIYPATPRLVHPAMAVVRESEVLEQCRILEAIHRPSPSIKVEDVAAINDHIKAVVAEAVPVPSHLGSLKPVKVRFCLDMSDLLNRHIKRWRFSYSKVHDAVALVEEGHFMAKLDLERYFNQLPLHPDDQGLLGVSLPPVLLPSGSDGPADQLFSSGYAHFGGSPFPALANAVTAAASEILRQHDVPNTFLTDDIFVSGATKAECQERLDRTVKILSELGFRLNPDKITTPSQQVIACA